MSCWGLYLAFPPPAAATPNAPGLYLQSHRESDYSSHPSHHGHSVSPYPQPPDLLDIVAAAC